MDIDERRAVIKLRVDVGSSPSSDSGDDRVGDDLQLQEEVTIAPVAWSHHRTVTGNINRRRLLSKQLSMKETSREAKWEKRRRQQILRRGSLVAVNEAAATGREGFGRCLTDANLDELRGSFELGFGFDEEKGGAGLCDTLPALDLYFAVNRQRLSDGSKLRSPTSTLSSSTLISGASSSPQSPHGHGWPSPHADAWTIFSPGDNPQLIKTRLRHWAQVVACSVKHGC